MRLSQSQLRYSACLFRPLAQRWPCQTALLAPTLQRPAWLSPIGPGVAAERALGRSLTTDAAVQGQQQSAPHDKGASEAQVEEETQATFVEDTWSTSSPYDVLGVERDATQAEIREAYLRQSKALHPDRAAMSGAGAAPAEGAAKRLREVQSAYFVLKNEKLRKEYDDWGQLAVPQKAWSPRMWSLLKRKSKPEDGTMAHDWGTEEPPMWLIVSGPLSVLFLAMLFSARNDIVSTVIDWRRMRAGAWPCPKCVILNEPDSTHCKECGDERPSSI